MMKCGRIKKYLKIGVELKLFEKKNRILKIKFENWNFEKLFENESFEN